MRKAESLLEATTPLPHTPHSTDSESGLGSRRLWSELQTPSLQPHPLLSPTEPYPSHWCYGKYRTPCGSQHNVRAHRTVQPAKLWAELKPARRGQANGQGVTTLDTWGHSGGGLHSDLGQAPELTRSWCHKMMSLVHGDQRILNPEQRYKSEALSPFSYHHYTRYSKQANFIPSKYTETCLPKLKFCGL